MDNWNQLKFWGSQEWINVQERLDGLNHSGVLINPDREHLFAALDRCPFTSTKVAILGQDPYPNSYLCTGLAFDVPDSCKSLPPSLQNILTEYSNDLGLPSPKGRTITKWADQGVLLWNVYPSCEAGRPGSHHWSEWETLSREIVEELDQRERPVIFLALGRAARDLAATVQLNKVIETSHPSPLSAHRGFFGSRIFSSANVELAKYHDYIDWRLP